ncbi:glycosyltransferase [Enterococcus casseliflavus]|uniref:glycosyltransferase n=1 Tax=Enterococcus casseliflavus TaxID=37734 RepID=UPI000763DDEF|nr:glycosyltransferase [Enterococcus casseliflavus]OJG28870.1 glycosyltransferase EpsF [Enterococcus casseliflavus]QQU22700.1 glycosyltransferase [Enterococcus casseliflavus]STQ30494.1 capsular polysaccharide biosynthesis protein [Enterococcus casseliflavus]
MLKILNIIGRRPTGGIGSVVKNYQSHFTEGIQYDYLLFSDEKEGAFDSYVKGLGSNVYVVPSLSLKNMFEINRRLNEMFSEIAKNYQVVHIHTVNVAFLVARKAKKNGIKKIIAHSHATNYSDSKIKAIRNKILCLNLKKLATHYVACSYEAGEFLFGKKSMQQNNVKIVKNAIEISDYNYSDKKRISFREELNFTKDDYVIGCIGRLTPQKNIKFALDVFSQLKKYKNSNKYKIVIVGEGPEYEMLRNFAKTSDICNSVYFLGYRNDIKNILCGIDLFLMPSLYEGLPVIGVEALSSGLPCIFSDSISKEFQSSKSFYISLDSTKEYWCNQIDKISQQKVDRKQTDTVELGYDINIEAKKLIQYYREIVG